MRALPGARVTLCPGERHFFFRGRLAEVLGALVCGSAPQAAGTLGAWRSDWRSSAATQQG
jgi:hypothetical protein